MRDVKKYWVTAGHCSQVVYGRDYSIVAASIRLRCFFSGVDCNRDDVHIIFWSHRKAINRQQANIAWLSMKRNTPTSSSTTTDNDDKSNIIKKNDILPLHNNTTAFRNDNDGSSGVRLCNNNTSTANERILQYRPSSCICPQSSSSSSSSTSSLHDQIQFSTQFFLVASALIVLFYWFLQFLWFLS